MAATRKGTWGGRRPGAGRKPVLQEPVRFSIELEGPQLAALQQLSEEQGTTVSALIRRAVDALLGRRKRK